MIYLASPIGSKYSKYRKNSIIAKSILEDKGLKVYAPWEMKIPNAWDISNTDWGKAVFSNDLIALQKSDSVVVLSYGRKSTAGTNWECGYAFGLGKKVLVVEMTDNIMSLMISNGCSSVIKGLDELEKFDFNSWPILTTNTEQK